jgi:hypothetical protein
VVGGRRWFSPSASRDLLLRFSPLQRRPRLPHTRSSCGSAHLAPRPPSASLYPRHRRGRRAGLSRFCRQFRSQTHLATDVMSRCNETKRSSFCWEKGVNAMLSFPVTSSVPARVSRSPLSRSSSLVQSSACRNLNECSPTRGYYET